MISGQCLTERRCGAYVDVEMFGLPADIVRKMYRTKVVQNNTVNPVFDEEPFTFTVCVFFSLLLLHGKPVIFKCSVYFPRFYKKQHKFEVYEYLIFYLS